MSKSCETFYKKKELMGFCCREALNWFLSEGNREISEFSLFNVSKLWKTFFFFKKKRQWKKFNEKG